MVDYIKSSILTIQEFFLLLGRTIRAVFSRPIYWNDIFMQMDVIGVGSLPIILLTGFFSGAIMALQMSRIAAQYGASGRMGQVVAITLVREMGPVLSSLMVAGRTATGIASEIGSMKVTEQIDAMRALGTDPVRKLVVPRLLATAIMLPLLTIIADLVGLVGGQILANYLLDVSATQFWTTAYQSLQWNDLVQGLLKPFIFAVIIAQVGCLYGLRTSGGTQGVGRATTEAMVVASVWIFISTFFIGKIFVSANNL